MKIAIFFLMISTQAALAAEAGLEKFYLSKCDSMKEETPEEKAFDGDPLSFAERAAIVTYTKSNYERINTALRNKSKLNPCDAAFVQILDGALQKLPDFNGIVYRGSSQNTKLTEGKPYPFAFLGYTSTSQERSVAEGFAEDRLEIISVRHGKDISRYSGAHVEGLDEREVLLPRGTRLRARKLEPVQEIEIEVFEDGESRIVRKKMQIVRAEE